MSYANFIPQVWSEALQREQERKRVFAEDCNRQWEGEIKQKGDTVHILGVGRPNIYTANKGAEIIEDPEEVANSTVALVIDQVRYFNFMVGDIDRAQAVNGLMDALTKEAAEGLANAEDIYIAGMASRITNIVTQNDLNESNVLETIDTAVEKLYLLDVNPSTELVLTVSPKFYTRFKRAYIGKDTDNSEYMKNGRVGKYGNVTIKISNNVYTNEGKEYLMLRSKRAIAFASQLTEIEAYRPEKRFADAVKGMSLFGAQIVRPEEICNLVVKY